MSELKTPETWCVELGVQIADRDGWRNGSRSWDEPIDRAEFVSRLVLCTVTAPWRAPSRGTSDTNERPTQPMVEQMDSDDDRVHILWLPLIADGPCPRAGRPDGEPAPEAHNRPEMDAQPTDGSLEVRR